MPGVTIFVRPASPSLARRTTLAVHLRMIMLTHRVTLLTRRSSNSLS